MSELEIRNFKNEVVGKESAEPSVFMAKYKPSLLNDFVVMQRRALRQGTHSTKTRAEVSGTGKKPFKQKGTGSARQGTLIGPHQPGGGIAFGPKPRVYKSEMNAKARSEAIRGALTQRRRDGKILVVDKFEVPSGKTKDAVKLLSAFKARSYVIVGDFDTQTTRSVRNVKTCKALSPSGLNVFDLLKHEQVILTKAGLAKTVERLKKVREK
jgi:large subunit ribosomal protein L4